MDPAAKRITHTRSEGDPETVRLTTRQTTNLWRQAVSNNIVGEKGRPTWRATIRALANGDFTLTPTLRVKSSAPVPSAAPVSGHAAACPPESEEDIIDRL